MTAPTIYFLIIFDHKTEHLAQILEFEDMNEALAAYGRREEEFSDESSTEVVLLGSDSLESVKKTHSLYFPDQGFTNGWVAELMSRTKNGRNLRKLVG